MVSGLKGNGAIAVNHVLEILTRYSHLYDLLSTRKALTIVAMLVIVLIVLVNSFLSGAGVSRLMAQSWPTPPPKSRLLSVTMVPTSQVTPVALPRSPGSVSVSLMPQLVLYPNFAFTSPIVLSSTGGGEASRITLGMSAGTITSPLQVVFEPLELSGVTSSDRGTIIRAFQYETFDYKGDAHVFEFRRPFVLKVPYADLSLSSQEARHLLVARFDENSNEWLPLVTWLDRANELLIVRVLKFGTFSVILDTP